uniref:CHR931 n=1 Tax=Arundo donax TaxID=35708 RepID=A0A0A8Z0Q5_ARUDO
MLALLIKRGPLSCSRGKTS